jgi:branched-chain amino acid transport system substrate-binding protein
MPAIAQGARIKLGYVSPQSGPLAAFAEADSFILSNFAQTEVGCELRGDRQGQPVQPEPGRGSGQELIIDDEVD